MDKDRAQSNIPDHFKFPEPVGVPAIPLETNVFASKQDGSIHLATIKTFRALPDDHPDIDKSKIEYYVHYVGQDRRNDQWVPEHEIKDVP